MVARQAVVDVVNAKNSGFVCTELCACNGNCLYATHLVGWQRNFYLFFLSFFRQYLATNMLFSLFLVSCCIVHLCIMFK